MVPNHSIIFIREMERENNTFINNNNPTVVNTVTRHISKERGGLGMINIDAFWKTLRH